MTQSSALEPATEKSQHIRSKSQHIRSKSGVFEGQSESSEDTGCHPKGESKIDASPCEDSPSGMQRQKKAPPVTDGALVEAAGIEPASRDESAISSTCVVADLNFVRTTGQRHPEIQTSLKLNLTIRVSNMTDCDLELVTSSLGSPAKPISRGSLFLGSHCERVIFCK